MKFASSPFWLALSLTSAIFTFPTSAQITPDKTLGRETSVVTPLNSQLQRLDGGALRGVNLFHSFLEFNIKEGHGAYFANPAAVENIFSRVTGNNPSHLFGTLGVLGEANLFFLNPNGIIFGSNATLDLQGAFVASTADSFVFPGGNVFSATNPESAPLLTVNAIAPVGLQFEGSGGTIINQGNLGVNAGEGLSLVGGTVVNQGNLLAPGGNISVVAVPEGRLVELGSQGEVVGWQELTASVTDAVDIKSGTAVISGEIDVVNQEGIGGEVQVLGEIVEVIGVKIDASGVDGGGTVLIGGDYQGKGDVPNASQTYINEDVVAIADGLGNSEGGKVIVWADETTNFYGNVSARGAGTGDGGFVEISGKETLLFRGGVDTSSDFGNLGTLLLDPDNITIENGNGTGAPQTISERQLEAQARSNNVIVQANNTITVKNLFDNELDLSGGSGIVVFTADADGDGVGDFVMEDTADAILAEEKDITISGVNITTGEINTDSTSFFLFSAGDAGDIKLEATGDISTSDLNARSVANGLLGDAGYGGEITLKAGGDISSSQVNSGSVSLRGNSKDAGVVTLEAGGNISTTQVFSASGSFGNGNVGSGNLITMRAGGDIIASAGVASGSLSSGNGNAGDGRAITLKAGGNISTAYFLSASFSNGNGNVGNGGAIDVEAGGDIFASGEVNSSSYSTRDGNTQHGGTIALKAGSHIFTGIVDSRSTSVGDGDTQYGGDISLNAGSDISTSGTITSSSISTGDGNTQRGGDIRIKAGRDISTGTITASSIAFGRGDSRDGGNVNLKAGSNISSDFAISSGSIAFGGGDLGGGGDINIETAGGDIKLPTRIGNVLFPGIGEVSSAGKTGGDINITSSATTLKLDDLYILSGGSTSAGSISITAPAMTLNNTQIQTGLIPEGTFGKISDGVVGDISLNAQENITLNRSGITATLEPSTRGQVGKISLVAPTLNVNEFSLIETTTFGEGNAGDVEIMVNNLFLDRSNIQSLTAGVGNAGKVNVTANQAVQLTNQSNIATVANSRSQGQGNNITINSPQLSLTGGSQLQALTKSKGDAGNVLLNIQDRLTISGVNAEGFLSGVFTSSGDEQNRNTGKGGDITINNSGTVTLSDGGVLSAQTFSNSPGGDIKVNANRLNLQSGGQILTSTLSGGKAGEVIVNARESLNINGSDPNFANRPQQPKSLRQGVQATPFNLSKLITETEPNNSPGEALFLSDNLFSVDTVNNPNPNVELANKIPYVSIQDQGDNTNTSDYYALEVTAGTRGIFDIDNVLNGQGKPITDSSNVESVELLQVQNGQLKVIWENPFSQTSLGAGGSNSTSDPYLRYTFTEGGTIYLKVNKSTNAVPNQSNYTLNISLESPNVTGSSITTGGAASGIFAQTNPGTTGDSGSVFVNTPTLNIRNGGQLAVNSQGDGIGGNDNIAAGDINLFNQGTITAATARTSGGNINLNVPGTILMRNNSLISAAAGGDGSGGNITLNIGFIVAVPNENSDVIARAAQGKGGQIIINATGVYGFVGDSRFLTPFSDLNASSDVAGNEGTVEIDVDFDVTQGLNSLPDDRVNTEVNDSCEAIEKDSTVAFFDIGKGGTLANPDEPLDADSWEWISLEEEEVVAEEEKEIIARVEVEKPCVF
ncbi:MAG: filamentous hemagglutinin N-terminal domain-containing protein [Spirulinaceae cyanobacterium]